MPLTMMPLTVMCIRNKDFKKLAEYFNEELIRNVGLLPENEVILNKITEAT